jgi:hypothetical protein
LGVRTVLDVLADPYYALNGEALRMSDQKNEPEDAPSTPTVAPEQPKPWVKVHRVDVSEEVYREPTSKEFATPARIK